jgi:hypothetical protein
MEKVVLMLFDYGNQVRETKYKVTREFAQKYQITGVPSAIKNTERAKRLAEPGIQAKSPQTRTSRGDKIVLFGRKLWGA